MNSVYTRAPLVEAKQHITLSISVPEICNPLHNTNYWLQPESQAPPNPLKCFDGTLTKCSLAHAACLSRPYNKNARSSSETQTLPRGND